MNDVPQDGARIGLVGLGGVGKAVARLLLDHRLGHEIVMAATKEPADIGRPLHQVAGSESESDAPPVADEIGAVLDAQPDLVILATGSFLTETLDDVLACASAGVDLVSPCEELAFPFNRFAAEAARIDRAAREGGATILGTGVNPGFVFDGLLSTATGVAWDIERIRGRRVVDVAGFGENIHLRLGIGYTEPEFEQGHEDGDIAGHVGFPESIEMVAERLGVALDGPVEERFEPMVAETAAPTNYGEVPKGKTEGFVQRAVGRVNGEDWIQFELLLHLRPRAAGFEPADTIEIAGIHPVHLTLSPGMDAIPATSAQLVNSVPVVLAADPGLRSVKDLPTSAAWLGAPRGDLLR